jgi:ABC-type antimicrobial peptide transport system permease subunit
VTAADPLTYVAVAAGLLLVAGIAALVPALSITRLDPAETLREA